MTVTFAETQRKVQGAERVVRGTITFDDSYDDGGEPYTPAMFGLTAINTVTVVNGDDAGAYRFHVDAANSKIVAFVEDGTSGVHAQVADTTDIDTITVDVEVTGY